MEYRVTSKEDDRVNECSMTPFSAKVILLKRSGWCTSSSSYPHWVIKNMILPKVLITSSGYPGLVLIFEHDFIVIIILAKWITPWKISCRRTKVMVTSSSSSYLQKVILVGRMILRTVGRDEQDHDDLVQHDLRNENHPPLRKIRWSSWSRKRRSGGY